MNVDTEQAIKSLADSAKNAKDSADALRFSQAALNLAHVTATIVGANHLQKQKES